MKAWLSLLFMVAFLVPKYATSQCAVPPVGCSNTDLTNFGFNSNNNAATIEYDNFISGFHSTVVRTGNGSFQVWGQRAAADGASNLLSPITFNSTNFPGLTGIPLKFSCGTLADQNQTILLATDGLYAWGAEGSVLDNAITSSTAFQKLTINGNANGLPAGIVPGDVKMMFATRGMLSIVTCSGNVYVMTQTSPSKGVPGGSFLQWWQIQTSTGPLSNVVAVRGSGNFAFIALKSDGTVWTWGNNTYLGDGTAAANVFQATQMTIPAGVTPKMIGATAASNSINASSFYLLATDGNLYSLGGNTYGQLGDWTTTERLTWVQPRYTSAAGPVMNNIVWIAPQDHHGNQFNSDPNGPYACINVLTSTGNLYAFGQGGAGMIGLPNSPTLPNNPGMPAGVSASDVILAVSTGGHTSMIIKQCEPNFGYVGHRIDGSMGNGSATLAFETVYTFATALVQVCGATTVYIDVSGTPPTGPTGKYCVGTVIPVNAGVPGGVLTVSGPGTLSGTNLTVTGPGTITLTYNFTSVCGLPTVATLDIQTEVCGVSISGNVFNDVNGLSGSPANTVDGAGTNAGGLTAVLVDNVTGLVVATSAVSAGGVYSFAGVASSTYTVRLTTNTATVGSLPPAVALPSGWVSTGENLGTGAGSDGTANGILSLGVVTANVTNANFGIQQPPTAGVGVNSAPNPGGTIQVTVPANTFGNTTASSDPNGGAVTGIVLTSFPSGTTSIFIDGVNYTTLAAITAAYPNGIPVDASGNPSVAITVDPTANGATSVVFTFNTIDAAGQLSSTPGTATLNFTSPLPIYLVSFEGNGNGCNAELNWITQSEINGDHFDIEKSIDGTSFNKVGAIAAQGTGNGKAYSFTTQQTEKVAYYRLKMVDNNGSFKYSAVVAVKNSCNYNAYLSIVPNPVKVGNTISLSFNVNYKGLAHVEVLNISGVSVQRYVIQSKVGDNVFKLNARQLPSGTYLVRLTDDKGNVLYQAQKLIMF